MSATPFSFSGALNLPGGPGLPNDPLPISMASSANGQAEYKLELTGSGTKVLDLGTIPFLKGLLISVEASTTADPIEVRINSSVTGGIEISPGGFMAFGSPTPDAGISALSIVYTTAVTVRIWALG